ARVAPDVDHLFIEAGSEPRAPDLAGPLPREVDDEDRRLPRDGRAGVGNDRVRGPAGELARQPRREPREGARAALPATATANGGDAPQRALASGRDRPGVERVLAEVQAAVDPGADDVGPAREEARRRVERGVDAVGRSAVDREDALLDRARAERAVQAQRVAR